jgi:hypothetical protein
MIRLLVSVAVAAGLGACGLIDESVDDFSLSLPEKEFRVDSDMMGLVGGSETFPSVECPAIDCAGMSSTFCEPDSSCMVSCGAGGRCEAGTTITLYQMVNMAQERPELATVDKQSGIDVTIDEITFVVEQNTFSPDSPPLPTLLVYVGPITAVDATDPNAESIGSIAPIEGGYTGPGQLEFTGTGRATLEEYMSDYTVPFNLIISGTITVMAGQEVPMGIMVGKITGRARADAI